jgi:hypothetical protein
MSWLNCALIVFKLCASSGFFISGWSSGHGAGGKSRQSKGDRK